MLLRPRAEAPKPRTFPAFEKYWAGARSLPLGAQVAGWETEYMARWPELLEKQIHNYYEEGVEWKQIARTRLVPHLTERLPRMRSLHRRFLKELPDSWARVCRVLQPDFSARFVIYVGICVGAGWAARYGGQPACLFGLENPAELVSAKNEGSPGAVSHEVAHLAHYEWRRKEGLRGIEEPRGPF